MCDVTLSARGRFSTQAQGSGLHHPQNRIEQVLFVLRCLLIAIERCMRALANPQPGRAHRSCTLTHTLMTVESS